MKWLTLILLVCTRINAEQADYVIVGTGTAGALLAKRLTDDKKTSVIALHSGQNFTDSFIIKYSKNTPFSVLASLLVPLDFPSMGLPSEMLKRVQDYVAISQNAAAPLYEGGLSTPQVFANNRQIPWVIALPGGGASSVNASVWCRATHELLAEWEAIAGPNWSVARLAKIYKQLEDYHGKTSNPETRGTEGPIRILQDSPVSPLSAIFSKALRLATGFPYVLDYNDPATPIGISERMQLTHKGHEGFFRESSATAFLNEKVMKPNGKGVRGRKLQVLFNSSGLRTLWDGSTAVGVEYKQGNEVKRVYAKKGVIVCAGLRSSPFLLHSGIGDATLLTSLGIPVIFDNPNVGQGLADQPHVLTLFVSNPRDSFAGTNRVFSQISWLPSPVGSPVDRQIRIATIDPFPGITLCLMDLCQPKSRGSVTINSADPLGAPVIDLGVLSDPSDLDLYVLAFQTYFKGMVEQLQAIDPIYQLLFPDPSLLDDPVLLSDFIREEIGPNMHFQSHCRMAPLDQGGVVDSLGQVHGVNRLFIADNSIVPLCMNGSPMSSADLIAENIAQLLGY